MEKDFSIDAFNRFLDHAASRGLMKRATAQSRKASANKVLGVLEPEELKDLRSVDLDHAFERFQNLQGMDYKPESLQVYLSRARTAVSEFISYVENPATFKSGGSRKPRAKTPQTPSQEEKIKEKHNDRNGQGPFDTEDHVDVPVLLRPNVKVQIINLPSDLTELEAERLAAIVKAYAMPEKK